MNRRPNQEALAAFNTRRRLKAGAVKAAAAKDALKILSQPHRRPTHSHVDAVILSQYKKALRARMSYSEASLAELAAMLGISRDTYSGRLRRGIAYAETVTS